MRSTELSLASALALALASALAPGCSRDAERSDGETSVEPTEHVRELVPSATNDGRLEVEAARLAESRARTEPVRQLARMMAEHHERASEELAALAGREHVERPEALDDEAQRELDALRDELGRDFDDEYLDPMLDEHQQAIRQLEREAHRRGDLPDLKAPAPDARARSQRPAVSSRP